MTSAPRVIRPLGTARAGGRPRASSEGLPAAVHEREGQWHVFPSRAEVWREAVSCFSEIPWPRRERWAGHTVRCAVPPPGPGPCAQAWVRGGPGPGRRSGRWWQAGRRAQGAQYTHRSVSPECSPGLGPRPNHLGGRRLPEGRLVPAVGPGEPRGLGGRPAEPAVAGSPGTKLPGRRQRQTPSRPGQK